jgi:DtxR family Mn-dependent transcriptional regulator
LSAGEKMKELHSFGESAEMYLKSVAELSVAGAVVPVTTLAEHLSISTVSASEMVHRLQARGLVEHQPYKGVRLTEAGFREANGILRRHRLWERFLTEHLQLAWDRAHDFACMLEHATDEAVIDALDAFLDHPPTCPHGNPIPDANGKGAFPTDRPLSSLAAGKWGIITRIQNEDSRLLRYMEGHALRPGTRFHLLEVGPYDGTLTLRVDERQVVISRAVANHIYIEVLSRAR